MVQETARINFEASNLDVVEARIKAIGGAINVLGGSVEVVVGAMGLIGVDEKVQKQFQQAATSAIAFADGAKRVFEGYKELREAADLFRKVQQASTVATAANTTATIANNTAQNASVGILGRVRTAFTALTAAMVRNPITAVAVAIGALVASFILLQDETENTTNSFEDLSRASVDLEGSLQRQEIINKGILLDLELRGATETKILATRQKQIDTLIKEIEAQRKLDKAERDRLNVIKVNSLASAEQKARINELDEAEIKNYNAILNLQNEQKSNQITINDLRKAGTKQLETEEEKAKRIANNIAQAQATLGGQIEALYGKLLANVAGDVTNIDTFAVAITHLRKGAIDAMVEIAVKQGVIYDTNKKLAENANDDQKKLHEENKKQAETQIAFLKSRQQDLEVFLTLFAMGTEEGKGDITKYREELIKVITATDNKVKDFAKNNPDLFKYGFSNLEKVVPDLIKLLEEKGYTDPKQYEGALGKFNKALLDILIKAENEQTQALADEITKRTTLTEQSRQQEINDLTSKYLLEDEKMKKNTSVRERLQEEFRRKLAEINKKWDNIDAERAQENYDKLVEMAVRAQVKQIEAESKDADERLVGLRKLFDDLRKEHKNNAGALAAINKVAAETFIDGAKTQFEAAQEEIAKFIEEVNKYAQLASIAINALSGIQRANHELRLNQIEAEYQERASRVVGSEEQIAAELQRLEIEKNKKLEDEKEKNFERSKKYQIAEATITGLSGAATAFATAFSLGPIAGPVVGGILAALVLANTAAQINLIKKQKYIRSDVGTGGFGGGGGGAGGGTGLSGIGGGNFLQPIPNPADPGNRTGSSNNPFGFMRAPTTSPNTPIRAYVVASDVSNGLEAESALNARRRL